MKLLTFLLVQSFLVHFVYGRHYINGLYHEGISDFNLVIPHRSSQNGNFISHHLNQFFKHDLEPRRIQKKSLSDPELKHFGIRIGDSLEQFVLWPNREFLSPSLIFEKIDDKPLHKREITNLMEKDLCYYTGKVLGYEDSTAALSTCDGLMGAFSIDDKNYFIEPVKEHSPNEEGHHLHVIYDLTKKIHRKKRSSRRRSWCAVQDGEEEWESGIEERIIDSMSKKVHVAKRQSPLVNKTSIKPKYMETAIVCDKSLIEFHKGHRDLDVYLLTVANTAFNAFRDSTFGSEMTLSLVRVIYLEKEGQEIDLNVSVSIDDTLASFNYFSELINFPEDNPLHHDVAMLASRVDMCNGPKLEDCVVCGVAKIGGLCRANSSANVAEDDGVYELAMTLVHEAGHLIGITHDGAEGLGKSCSNPANYPDKQKSWIMSVVDGDSIYFGWSECSRAMAGTFMRNGWADCMNDEPKKTNKKFTHVAIGTLYNRDEQCYLSTIRKGKQYESNRTCGDPSECGNLYCLYNDEKNSCRTMNHVVADGTSCGADKWCWNSRCVPRGQRPDSIDGGWSDWSGWSDCSRTCGGGIQVNRRSCDNPQQSNGGRYCQGDDQLVKLCNLEMCDESARNRVCKKKFHGVALFLPGRYCLLTGEMRKYEIMRMQKNQCRIACMSFNDKIIWSNVTVPNGESCEWGKKPQKRCLFGECVKFGCNNEINSDIMRDECGICGGDTSSCTIIEGRWKLIKRNNESSRLHEVTTFPKGAFNIRIIETISSECKISLLNADKRTVYINDYEDNNKTNSVMGPKKFQEGVEGYYSIDGSMENITIEGPIRENIIFKVVYLEDEADFKWKYSMVFGNETAVKEERNYRWEQDGWTECNKVCEGGIQKSTFSCVEEKLGKVGNNLCLGEDQPDLEIKACNEQLCKIRWKVGEWGDCHACRGKGGIRARGVECMQQNPEKGADDILLEDEKCRDIKPKKYMLCNSKESSNGPRKKRCTLGLPDQYMDSVWSQLTSYQ